MKVELTFTKEEMKDFLLFDELVELYCIEVLEEAVQEGSFKPNVFYAVKRAYDKLEQLKDTFKRELN